MCLIDKRRTLAFKKAIEETVKPGDTVIDVGSGTGIMAFFAANVGANKVLAVEVDHLLAESLRRSIELNNFGTIVEVVEGEAQVVDLPKGADVIVAEMVDTGLLDELQVKVINNLRQKGVISQKTKIIPYAYETFIRLAQVNDEFYGFKLAAPIHDWPFYHHEEWYQPGATYFGEPESLGYLDFQAGPIEPVVKKNINFKLESGQTANAIEISGLGHLTSNISLGPTNSFNGNKILLLAETISGPQDFSLQVSYEMSAGLGSFTARLA